MTWKELIAKLSGMTPEQKEQDATVFSQGEFYPVTDIRETDDDNDDDEASGILDDGHIYVVA